MRPNQECLLLASNGVLLDDRQPDSPGRAQVAELRDFVRSMLARKSQAGGALRDVDLFRDRCGLAISPKRHDGERTLLPVDSAQAAIAFDLAALLHAPQLRKYAVLPPLALAHDMALIAAADDPMPILAMLQDALRHAHAVTVFGSAAACDLALLGAARIAVLPLPALSSRSGDPERAVAYLFDHEPARGRAAAVAAAVTAAMAGALPGAAATVVAASGSPATPPYPGLHLHLGVAPSDSLSSAPPWRVVDSFAARCPVVHLMDSHSRVELAHAELARAELAHAELAHAELAEYPEMAVEPMRTGILAATVAEAVAGLVRLAADAALADVFRRHAGHAAAAFNRRIEKRMRELSS